MVESLVGYVRRNALVLIPDVQSLEELNTHLLSRCEESATQDTVPYIGETVAAMWGKERPTLHPLPPQPFEACRLRTVTVSKMSTVTLETNQYSVPCTYVGHKVWLKAFVDKVSIVAQNEVIATHARCDDRDQMVLELDHYLDILLKKPRAVRDARAMNSTNVPDSVRAFHREMRRRHGADGDRAFVRFLLLHREVGMQTIASVFNTAAGAEIYHDVFNGPTLFDPGQRSVAYDIGRLLGDGLSILLGIGTTAAGLTEFVGSAVLDATGVGLVVGWAVGAVSVATTAEGAVTLTRSVDYGLQDARALYNKIESGGTEGTGNTPLGRGSTGRIHAANLDEQLAMKQAMSNPKAGQVLPVKMTDPRWPSLEGWVKMQQVVKLSNGNRITIHYVYNTITRAVDDFKFR